MLNNFAVDKVLHALAEPTRRAIVDRLSHSPTSVSELAKPFDMSLAAVVQHLQVLEDSGVIRSDKVGRVRTCRIEPKALRLVEQWLTSRRALWERRLDRRPLVLDKEHALERGRRRASKPRKKS